MAVLTFCDPYERKGLKRSASLAFSLLKIFRVLQGLFISRWKKKTKTKQPFYDLSA